MNQNRTWIGRYVAVIVIALVLPAAFGSMDLFKTTAIFGNTEHGQREVTAPQFVPAEIRLQVTSGLAFTL